MIRKYFPFCFYVLVSVLCLGRPSLAYPAGSFEWRGVSLSDNVSETDSITPLKIGDKIPDELWEMEFPVVRAGRSDPETVKLGDYRDKLIILDFWATWCAPCISSLHKLDTLQKEFAEGLLVFPTSYEAQDKVSKFFADKGWSLPTSFDETYLKKYFPHRSIPHQVWVKDGEVMAITGPEYASRENLRDILDGQRISMTTKQEQARVNLTRPLLLDGNGGKVDDLLFFSLFSNYLDGATNNGGHKTGASLMLTNRAIPSLCNFAFSNIIPYEESSHRVIYELPDSVKRYFVPSKEAAASKVARTVWFTENAYCYNLILPKDTPDSLKYEYLKSDLNRLLERNWGVQARIERRRTMCLALIRNSGETSPLPSEAEFEYDVTDKGVVYRNTTVDHFLNGVRSVNIGYQLPIINATGIDYPIDISINGSRNIDSESFIQQLEKQGLTFRKDYYEIDMIVLVQVTDNPI